MNTESARRTTVALAAAGLVTALAIRAKRRRRDYDFRGRAVVITGGSRGLGLVLARQLSSEGARVALIARDADELRRAEDDIRRRQPSADVLAVPADVREREDVEQAVSRVIDHYGGIDVLINNAGVIQAGPVEHMTLADYDAAMKTHFWGPLFFVLAVLPQMRRQGRGRIVNISSIGGLIPVPHLVPYSASKFALTGLSEGLRAELAGERIVVTTVCPGLMRIGSPLHATFKGRHAQEYAWFAIASSLPLLTVNAERAARQILDACRRGDARLIITLQAKLAVFARTVAPELFSAAMAFVDGLLPQAAGPEGDVARPGHTVGSEWASSPVLAPMYAAARNNNELPGGRELIP